MPPTSDDLYSVFLADLSEAERERVRSYADRFGIEPTDAVWALMIVLGHYSDLYEAVPEKVKLTVQGILEKIQSAAAAEAESSRVRLQESLNRCRGRCGRVRGGTEGP
jgi:predicted RecB family endonuclease